MKKGASAEWIMNTSVITGGADRKYSELLLNKLTATTTELLVTAACGCEDKHCFTHLATRIMPKIFLLDMGTEKRVIREVLLHNCHEALVAAPTCQLQQYRLARTAPLRRPMVAPSDTQLHLHDTSA